MNLIERVMNHLHGTSTVSPSLTYPAGFTIAINRVLGNEGGYTDGAGDPGGETNWGISKRSYPTLDIKSLTRDQAVAIYWRDYFLPAHCMDMPGALAYQVLDFAVNSGVATALKHLQSVLRIAADGVWGPTTQAAISAATVKTAVNLYLADRLDYFHVLSNFSRAGAGWTARVAMNLRYAALDT